MSKGKSHCRAMRKNFMRSYSKKAAIREKYDQQQYDKPTGDDSQ